MGLRHSQPSLLLLSDGAKQARGLEAGWHWMAHRLKVPCHCRTSILRKVTSFCNFVSLPRVLYIQEDAIGTRRNSRQWQGLQKLLEGRAER